MEVKEIIEEVEKEMKMIMWEIENVIEEVIRYEK